MSDSICGRCTHGWYCEVRANEHRPILFCSQYAFGTVTSSAPPPGWDHLAIEITTREATTEEKEPGRKFDIGKLRWDLVQPLILQEYVKVLTFGAKKYAPNNWRKVEDARNRYFSALLRHIWAWWLGERNDPESRLHHFGHAMCCIAFLAEPELEEAVRASLPTPPCRHYGLLQIGRDRKPRCSLCGEVLQSDDELHADPGGVRESGSPGPEGSGGQTTSGS